MFAISGISMIVNLLSLRCFSLVEGLLTKLTGRTSSQSHNLTQGTKTDRYAKTLREMCSHSSAK